MLLRSLDHMSFNSLRQSLQLLNFFYLLIALLLITTGGYAHNAAIVTSVSIAGGIIAAGVFLLCVALLGVYGARHQHQAALFFYMLILCLVFFVQFCVAAACLGALSRDNLEDLIGVGWNASSKATLWDAQKAFGCCGLRTQTDATVNCKKLECWSSDGCPPCMDRIVGVTSGNLSRIGVLGFVFSFTELAGVLLAHRYRNAKNPRFNPETLFT